MSQPHFLLLVVLSSAGCLHAREEDDDDDATVTDDLLGMLVTPDSLILPVGESAQLEATGLLEDRESVDLTASVAWQVDGRDVLDVSDRLDEEGLATGLAPGTALVVAVYEGVSSPEVVVTVTDAEIDRLTVAPTSVALGVGDAVQMKATAMFSSGETGDVTGQVRWITGDGSVAQFEGGGELEGVGAGETEVYASWEELSSDTVPVSVTGASSTGQADLAVSAASGSVSGGVLDLSVTVHNYGDASAAGFWIDVFVDDSAEPDVGDVGDAYEWVDYVGPDSATSATFQISVGSGDHTVYVFADTNDDIDESDESDNVFATTVSDGGGSTTGGANLEITWFDYYTYKDYYLYYVVDVTNSGDEDTDWFYVDLFYDQSSSPELYDDGDDYTSIAGLAAGETEYADFWAYGYCDYCVSWVMVDGYDYIDETDEDDNIDGPLYVYSE